MGKMSMLLLGFCTAHGVLLYLEKASSLKDLFLTLRGLIMMNKAKRTKQEASTITKQDLQKLHFDIVDDMSRRFVTKEEAKKFTTKEDLKTLQTETHADLERMYLAVQKDLESFVTKDEFHRATDKLFATMQHILENEDTIIGKLTKMEEEQIFGFHRIDHHEARITTLEKHVGIKVKRV